MNEEKYIDLKTDSGLKRISAEIVTYSSDNCKEYDQSRRAYQNIKMGMDSVQKVGEEKGFKHGLSEGMKKEKYAMPMSMKAMGLSLFLYC